MRKRARFEFPAVAALALSLVACTNTQSSPPTKGASEIAAPPSAVPVAGIAAEGFPELLGALRPSLICGEIPRLFDAACAVIGRVD